MKRFHIFLLSLLLLVGVVAGCSSDPADDAANNNIDHNESQTEQNDVEEEASFPVTVTDGNGEDFTIEEEPETIVSLMPSNTEIAYALGLGEKMIAGSDFDNYPEEALELEKIGGMELNIEAIVALDPDLVLALPGNPIEGIEQLADAGVPVLVVNDATNFAEVYESIDMIGKVTGAVDKSEEIIEQMQADLAILEEKAEEIDEADMKRVYVEISPAPEIFTPGKGTFQDDILSLIRAINVAADEEGWAELSEEAVIEMDPEVIILTYDFVEDAEDQLKNRDGWQDISAVINDDIIMVDEDIVSRPGPRLIEGVETLAKAIYPDVFNE